MSKPTRRYGRSTRTKPPAEQLFAELPRTPVKATRSKRSPKLGDSIDKITEQFVAISLAEQSASPKLREPRVVDEPLSVPKRSPTPGARPGEIRELHVQSPETSTFVDTSSLIAPSGLRILTWDDVCPFGDTITKIAEASYAEVYRVTNARGTSIIKVIRLTSPIKAQTKAQVNAGLVDEEPHSEEDLAGELRISEWLADIPGFVVYKERYMVQGKAPKTLLETHQGFHRKAKRKDPDRLQFYPSPSRYLDDTRFLVVELGDAGVALEDFALSRTEQVWDVFFLTAIALARAEDLVRFEHRDLHEGNLCIRQTAPPTTKPATDTGPRHFGHSGLDITILDYGLSRGEGVDSSSSSSSSSPVAYDLEKDLSLFASTHAAQCKVYRQMRSYLLRGDRLGCLPPRSHVAPYAADHAGRPLCWKGYFPYTNVLWLAYIYSYLLDNFRGGEEEEKKRRRRRKKGGEEVVEEEEEQGTGLAAFRKETRELWAHLDPDAPKSVLSFSSAGDVVRFGLEAGWITEEQVMGGGDGAWEEEEDGDGDGEEGGSFLACETESIVEASSLSGIHLRRSPRRRQTP